VVNSGGTQHCVELHTLPTEQVAQNCAKRAWNLSSLKDHRVGAVFSQPNWNCGHEIELNLCGSIWSKCIEYDEISIGWCPLSITEITLSIRWGGTIGFETEIHCCEDWSWDPTNSNSLQTRHQIPQMSNSTVSDFRRDKRLWLRRTGLLKGRNLKPYNLN
jgi:hypothetical protein